MSGEVELREAADWLRQSIEAEWFNGNMTEDCRDRLQSLLPAKAGYVVRDALDGPQVDAGAEVAPESTGKPAGPQKRDKHKAGVRGCYLSPGDRSWCWCSRGSVMPDRTQRRP